MAETVTRDLRVSWITSRIEFDLNKTNVSSEMAAISWSGTRSCTPKKLNLWWEERDGRRWLKAVNLHN